MLEWTLFHSLSNTKCIRKRSDFLSFCSYFKNFKQIKAKSLTNDMCFSLNFYEPGKTRGNDGILYMTGAVLDFDGKSINGEPIKFDDVTKGLKKYTFIAHTTFSHTEEKHSFRVILPFKNHFSKSTYQRIFYPNLINHLKKKFNSDLIELDKQCSVPSQAYHFPVTKNLDIARLLINEGQNMEPESFLDNKKVLDALSYINPDINYHDWIKIGMSIKSEFGDAGFDVWDKWSSEGKKYKNQKTLDQHWKSFNGSGVNISSLYYIASQNGYKTTDLLGNQSIHNISYANGDDKDGLKSKIILVLQTYKTDLSPQEIAYILGKSSENEFKVIRRYLRDLLSEGIVVQTRYGKYQFVESKDSKSYQEKDKILSNIDFYGQELPKKSQELLEKKLPTGQSYQNIGSSSEKSGSSLINLGSSVGSSAQKISQSYQDINGATGSSSENSGSSLVALENLYGSSSTEEWKDFDKQDIFYLSHTPRLESIYSFYISNSPTPVPYLSLGAAISIVGFMLRDSIACKGKKTNFYNLLVAESGVGKQGINSLTRSLLEHFSQDQYVTSRFGSVQALHKKMIQNDGSVYVLTDEAAHWFGSFNKKNISEHYEQIKTTLKECFSSEKYSSIEFKNEQSIVFNKVFVNCLFLGTPVIFSNISHADVLDGLIGRMLVFSDLADEIGVKAKDLIEDKKLIFPDYLDLKIPQKCQLYEKEDDITWFYDEFRGVINSVWRSESGYKKTLLARMPEHYNKLLMLTVDEFGNTTLECCRWAASVAINSYKTICGLMEDSFDQNQFSIDSKKILNFIKKHKFISEGRVRNNFRTMRPKYFDESIEHLVACGEITRKMVKHIKMSKPITYLSIGNDLENEERVDEYIH